MTASNNNTVRRLGIEELEGAIIYGKGRERGFRVRHIFYERQVRIAGASNYIVGATIETPDGRMMPRMAILYRGADGKLFRSYTSGSSRIFEALGNCADRALDEIERVRPYHEMPERAERGGRNDG